MEVIKDKATVDQIVANFLGDQSRYPEGTDVRVLAQAYFDLKRERGKVEAVNNASLVLIEAAINWKAMRATDNQNMTASEILLNRALDDYMGL